MRICVRKDFAVNDIVSVLKGMDFRKVLHEWRHNCKYEEEDTCVSYEEEDTCVI